MQSHRGPNVTGNVGHVHFRRGLERSRSCSRRSNLGESAERQGQGWGKYDLGVPNYCVHGNSQGHYPHVNSEESVKHTIVMINGLLYGAHLNNVIFSGLLVHQELCRATMAGSLSIHHALCADDEYIGATGC